MRDLQRIATTAPSSLFFDGEFWRANRFFGLTVLASISLIVGLYPLTYPRSGDPAAWLSVLIHTLVIIGLAIAGKSLARTEVDDAIARLVEARAAIELGKIKGKLKDRVFLDQIESNLLPHNPNHSQGTLKIMQYILNEARDRKFHASFLAAEPLRSESLGDLFRIQTFQKIAVQLGILGTFAGLVVALSRLSLSGQDLLGSNALSGLLNALYIAFSTSIAGLQVAIILGLTGILVRRRQEIFFKNLESASATITSLARNSINRDDFLVELEQVRTVITQLGERVHAQSGEMETQTAVIRSGLGRLSDLKIDLNTFLHQVHAEQALVLEEMKSVYDIISPRRVAEELKEALTEGNRQLSKSFREELDRSLTGLEKLNLSLRLAEEVGGRMQQQLDTQSHIFTSSHSALREAVTEFASVVQGLSHLRTDALVGPVSRGAPLAGPTPATSPSSSRSQPEGPNLDRLERTLGRVALQLESVSRELARNSNALSTRQVSSASIWLQPVGRKARIVFDFVRASLVRLSTRLAAAWTAISKKLPDRRRGELE